MWNKAAAVLTLAIGVLLMGYYAAEPWLVTFVDYGPYFSSEYDGPIDELPVQSSVALERFGRVVYTLEARRLPDEEASVLVLRRPDGRTRWALVPVKDDGELGTVKLVFARMTWYGGWRVAIQPSRTEGGGLYLNVVGGFRFFNHSW